jgi:hypothetical protein
LPRRRGPAEDEDPPVVGDRGDLERLRIGGVTAEQDDGTNAESGPLLGLAKVFPT